MLEPCGPAALPVPQIGNVLAAFPAVGFFSPVKRDRYSNTP
jgi:hypothetical protein